MSNWVKDLDVEYENALIRFDLSKLTLIADLDNKKLIEQNHVLEAFSFRKAYYNYFMYE